MECEVNIGMLWFDNDPKVDVVTKINRATDYYYKKYGQEPDLCFVNPATQIEPSLKGASIEVQTDQMVLPDHFWLGIKSC